MRVVNDVVMQQQAENGGRIDLHEWEEGQLSTRFDDWSRLEENSSIYYIRLQRESDIEAKYSLALLTSAFQHGEVTQEGFCFPVRADAQAQRVGLENQLWDVGQFPLIHPYGAGGYHGQRFFTSAFPSSVELVREILDTHQYHLSNSIVQRTAFAIQQEQHLVEEELEESYVPQHPRLQQALSTRGVTFHKYAKYLVYQMTAHLHLFPRLYEEWLLDTHSRAEEKRFGQVQNCPDFAQGFCDRNTKNSAVNYSATRGELEAAVQAANVVQRENPQHIPAVDAGGREFVREADRVTDFVNGTNHLKRATWTLSSSIPGTPAAQRMQIQNGMAVITRFGNPTFFITFTANGKWDEIASLIPTGATYSQYPDIVARVFKQKLAHFITRLSDGTVFGHKKLFIQRVIEFQTRGLPHAHILLRLNIANPLSAEDVNRFVCARLFIHEACPRNLERTAVCDCAAHRLSKIVETSMIHVCTHGRCLQRATAEGQRNGVQFECKRRYPKPPTPIPISTEKGFWSYPRLCEEDRYVVAYMPLLTLEFDAHINIEVASSIRVIAYCRKYMSKIPKEIRFRIEKREDENLRNLARNGEEVLSEQKRNAAAMSAECLEWQNARHICSCEAAHVILEIQINSSYPTVQELKLHLPGEKRVYGKNVQVMQERLDRPTDLERYFAFVSLNGQQVVKRFEAEERQLVSSLTYREFWQVYSLCESERKRNGPVRLSDGFIPPHTHDGTNSEKEHVLACTRVGFNMYPSSLWKITR